MRERVALYCLNWKFAYLSRNIHKPSISFSMKTQDFDNPDYEYDNELITGHGLKRVYRLRKPIRPYHDKKKYDSVFLPNSMRILLISEQKISKDVRTQYDDKKNTLTCVNTKYGRTQSLAGCSLTVGVGYFSDPPEIPGMAYLLQRIILRGCKSKPKDFSGFESYIKSISGHFKGSTGGEYTNFTFGCKLNDMCEAMQNFSEYFINPLMPWFVMDEERKLIAKEFADFRPTDNFRMEKLLCSLAASGNPAYKSKWGNFNKISEVMNDKSFCDAVNAFRQKYYSSNLMTVAFQADLPLDILRKIAVHCFAEVPNNMTLGELFEVKDPFDTNRFNKVYLMNHGKESFCTLNINWGVPPSLPMYRMNALEYIASLLKREGRGGLIKHLRQNGLANNINAGLNTEEFSKNSVYSLFRVSIEIDDDKKCFIHDTLAALYGYLNVLKSEGPCKNYFKELYLIKWTEFAISNEKPVMENVKDVSKKMQYFDSIDYLSGDSVFYEFWPNLVQQYLNLLVPSKANYVFCSSYWWKTLSLVEDITKTKYAVEAFSSDVVNEWETIEHRDDFHCPSKNIYLSLDFTFHHSELANDNEHPRLVNASKLGDVWFQADQKYRKPVSLINIHLTLPRTMEMIEDSVLLDLYLKLLNHILDTELSPAREALINCSIIRTKTGICIGVNGLSEKIPLVLKHVSNYMCNLHTHITPELFTSKINSLFKEYYIKHLDLKSICYELKKCLLYSHYMHTIEKYSSLTEVSWDSFKLFSETLFNRVYVQCLAQGNLLMKPTIDLMHHFLEALGVEETRAPIQTLKRAEIQPGEKCCLVKSPYQLIPSHYILNSHSIGPRSPKSSIAIKLVISLLQTPMFVRLAHKYFKATPDYNQSNSHGLLSYNIGVQFPFHPNTGLEIDKNLRKITNFQQEVLVALKKLPQQDFEHYICQYITTTNFNLQNIQEDFKKNWREIIQNTYQFDFGKFEAQMLETIHLDDIITLYESHINPNNKLFKKLSVNAYGLNEKDLKITTAFVLPEKIELEHINEVNDKPRSFFIDNLKSYKESFSFIHPQKKV